MKRLVQPGTSRAPRCRVLVDGTVMPGLVSVEVTSNSHYQADKHRLQLALNAPGGAPLDWWGADERKGTLFDVRVSLDGDERSLIVGEADKIDIRPATGTVEIDGRDLTARLIDNKLQDAHLNQTASEVAILLANRRGLTPVVQSTTTLVDRFYAADHDRVSHDQFSRTGTEWDLLCFLAQQEGFNCFVQGTELHFEKALDPTTTEPYRVRWNQDSRISDVTDLRLGRSLTLAKDVVVLVRSWHSGKGKSFTRSSPAGAATGPVNSGKAQRFVFTRPNLSEDDAQKLADSLRADITRHERTIDFDCPGELDLTPRDMILLSGAGGWDQLYFINSITRRLSFDGFSQSVAAKNHNTESQAAAP